MLLIFIMFDKIDKIIKEKKLTPSSCDYHTLRTLENKGKIRALVIKGDNKLHIELICPKCGTYNYMTQEWKQISKGAKIRFRVECPKCGNKIKVEKLKGKK
jgi:predicted nucleic-acid-binding Zn-ribbon protein